MSELLRDADEKNPRVPVLMGAFRRIRCKKREIGKPVVNIHWKNWPKIVMVRASSKNILLIELQENVRPWSECFQTRRNRTLDRHTFVPREQKPTETLNYFWNVLKGVAARCDSRNQKEGLVHDLNMNKKQFKNKSVQDDRNTCWSLPIRHCIHRRFEKTETIWVCQSRA